MKQVVGQLDMFGNELTGKQTWLVKGILKEGFNKRFIETYVEAHTEKQAKFLFLKEWEEHKVFITDCVLL